MRETIVRIVTLRKSKILSFLDLKFNFFFFTEIGMFAVALNVIAPV